MCGLSQASASKRRISPWLLSEDVTDAEVKARAEEVIDEEEVAIAAGASAKAVEASWTAAPDPLVPARASADASSSKEAELLLTLRLVAGVVTTGV